MKDYEKFENSSQEEFSFCIKDVTINRNKQKIAEVWYE